jgi:hypothetical protein
MIVRRWRTVLDSTVRTSRAEEFYFQELKMVVLIHHGKFVVFGKMTTNAEASESLYTRMQGE